MEDKQTRHRQLFRRLRCVDRLHRSRIESELRHPGIHRSQHMVLMRVARQDHPCSQAELARQMEISAPAMAANIQRLEEAGYIERTADPGDKRYNRIGLTDKGRQLAEESSRVFENVDDDLFHGFSAAELDQLTRYLERMQKNLQG